VRWPLIALSLGLAMAAIPAAAQVSTSELAPILEQELQPGAVTAFQLAQHLKRKIPALSTPASPDTWTDEVARLRQQILEDVAFHGWPRSWIDADPRFTDLGSIPSGPGYRLRKLRYEIVPGFESTAILCEPERRNGRGPAVLDLSGHESAGKAAEHTQRRCVTLARMGIVVLDLEWPGFGELNERGNSHDFAAHLDLVGANALGFFYLAMRRGLDYLGRLPEVDPRRLGVTGWSGGGWQTTVLGGLDARVAVAVEVAGVGSLENNLIHPGDTDEVEENATDLAAGRDYPHLVAMRAPRPTLLIHNAEDSCCFRAGLVKPYLYDPVRPFFRLFGSEANLAWHQNDHPQTHEYGADSRQVAYRFFARHFELPAPAAASDADVPLKTREELAVGVPANNLTILNLARRLAAEIQREPIPSEPTARESWRISRRRRLADVIRFRPRSLMDTWRLWNTQGAGLESVSYRFDFDDALSATAVWLKAASSPADAPGTIVLHDKGRSAAAELIADRINAGEQVLALDVLLIGDTIPEWLDVSGADVLDPLSLTRARRAAANAALLLATVGERALGIAVGQLLAVADWFERTSGGACLRLETTGIRSQVIALAAAALRPQAFTAIVAHEAMLSLDHVLEAPVQFSDAPDLFCLDLYKEFDLDHLQILAAPTRITTPDDGEATRFARRGGAATRPGP
jgi:dienelactone hydrolase